MAASLEVKFAGINMINPFILSSAPPTTNGEMIARSFDAGWGGAVIKTLEYDTSLYKNVKPRMHSYKLNGDLCAFTNFELGSPKSIHSWAEDVLRLKREYPKHVVLVSMMHSEGQMEEQWREVTRIFNQTGADGYELNFSCSHGMAESGGGAAIADNEETIKKVASWVLSETTKPVMVKLPAMTSNLPGKALAAQSCGVNAIATINTINSLSGVDIKTFVPTPNVGGKSAFQGMSGPAIKPIGLRSVAQIAKAVKIPISGMGGISNWKDAVEYILVGAKTLQVCSAVMQYGYRIIKDLNEGLLDYMNEMGFNSIDDFCGKALPNIVKHNELSREYKVISDPNLEKCIGCGLCQISCKDSGYGAITLGEDRKPIIDVLKCDGCGMCMQVCPVDCIRMKRI